MKISESSDSENPQSAIRNPQSKNPQSEIIDISQTITEGIAVWPGDQKFRRRWNMRLSDGDSCNLSSVTMSLHTGTHVDAPFHFIDSGLTVTGVSLTHYIGPARVVTLKVEQCISAADLARLTLDGVQRILFKTHRIDPSEGRFDPHFVWLTEDGAEFLGARNVFLVGTDAPSIDDFHSKSMRTHKALMSHGIAILEGLRLGHVQDGDYELVCLPLKLAGADGSPVRAILLR